jgi:energy-coupling factor transport system substrate-specific component
VSWELTSFLILGAVLVAGFAWYERSRPPSQVVALVAALAALAIAGRVAFAAFPNVKPTTDIVIFAGYALGPAPGFAVGALTALVSNLWFGQGPWTPWQMAGWGLCGILGAALAVGARNVGRLGLAATCGLAGIAYGALLNFSLMATYGGDLSLERFGVLQVRALPFDLAHAAGNVAFALLAGPAMVRMLIRFRERFEWQRGGGEKPPPAHTDRRPRLRGAGVAALLLVAFSLAALVPAPASASDVSRAAAWLRSAQNSDGGYGSAPDDGSGAEMTAWAMLGLEAAGDNPLDVTRAGRTPVDYLRGHTAELKSPGDLARTIVALEGAGADPRDLGGANLVSQLLDKRRGNGSYEGWPGSTAFAAIALRTAGAEGSLEESLAWLRKVQNDDGGWGDVPGSPSTADGTGIVMQALAGSKAAQRGLSYLRNAQRPGGGFPLGGNAAVNSQSTAWAVQGILAVGGNPGSFRRGGASALDYLAAQQAGDGHYRYSKSSDQTPVWVTGQVVMAAAGRSLPIAPPPREPKPAQPNTGGIPPSAITPPASATPLPLPDGVAGNSGASSGSPGASASGGGGPLPNALPPPGQTAPGAPAPLVPPAGQEGQAPPAFEPDASASEGPSGSGSESSPLAAVALGLGAGALLFGLGFGARRVWMRQRYGL